MDLAVIAVGILFALSGFLALGWLARERTGQSGWIDAAWTAGVGIVGVVVALLPLSALSTWPAVRQAAVAALVALWSLRLGSHIVARNLRTADDPRYAALARDWGAAASRRMLFFAMMQAAVSVPLVLSIALAAQNPISQFRLQDWFGVAVLAVAVAGEGIADRQLRNFAARLENRGRVCDVGLWRWSRHPNYFFEWLGWCAYPLFAIDLAGGHPWGWLAVASPICMYWLLVHVSGIPPLERHMAETRGEPFRVYRERTSAFFPAPPARQ